MGPLEIPPPKGKDPRREPSDPPLTEFSPEEQSTKSQVLAFKTSRFSVSAPTAVVVAVLTFAGTWFAKPTTTVAMSPEDRAALQACGLLNAKVDRLEARAESFRSWIEPQIGILLVRTDSRAYTAPPPTPEQQAPSGFAEALRGKKP